MGSDCMAVPMSTTLTTDPMIDKIKFIDGFKQEKLYNFNDLTFRVDLVGNNGNGDKNHYANLAATNWHALDQKPCAWGEFSGKCTPTFSDADVWRFGGYGVDSLVRYILYFFAEMNLPMVVPERDQCYSSYLCVLTMIHSL